MCIGATPPYDHPHVFCDMGGDNEFICSYCSTLYRHNPALHGYEAKPAGVRVDGLRAGLNWSYANGIEGSRRRMGRSREHCARHDSEMMMLRGSGNHRIFDQIVGTVVHQPCPAAEG